MMMYIVTILGYFHVAYYSEILSHAAAFRYNNHFVSTKFLSTTSRLFETDSEKISLWHCSFENSLEMTEIVYIWLEKYTKTTANMNELWRILNIQVF